MTQRLGIFRDEIDAEGCAEVLQMFWEAYLLRDATDGFVAGRERVLRTFVGMLSWGVLNPSSDQAHALHDLLLAGAK